MSSLTTWEAALRGAGHLSDSESPEAVGWRSQWDTGTRAQGPEEKGGLEILLGKCRGREERARRGPAQMRVRGDTCPSPPRAPASPHCPPLHSVVEVGTPQHFCALGFYPLARYFSVTLCWRVLCGVLHLMKQNQTKLEENGKTSHRGENTCRRHI